MRIVGTCPRLLVDPARGPPRAKRGTVTERHMWSNGVPRNRLEVQCEGEDFLMQSTALSGLAATRWVSAFAAESDELDDFITRKMERDHIPGIAACLIKGQDVVWSRAYGMANIARKTPMTLDHLQNIASISKTVTTTAIMQLFERGLIQLDEDLNETLPFAVRNPKRPTDTLTVRQLLTHTSYIADGIAYSRQYKCGDPRISLAVWLREYLTPDGVYYDPERNFHPWASGSRWSYCNVSFGILGYLVELKSGIPFPSIAAATSSLDWE